MDPESFTELIETMFGEYEDEDGNENLPVLPSNEVQTGDYIQTNDGFYTFKKLDSRFPDE